MNPNFTKNHLLNFINPDFETEKIVNPLRCKEFNLSSEKNDSKKIIYLMSRNLRIEDNLALNFAVQKAKNEALDLEICVFLEKFNEQLKEKQDFLNKNIEILKNNLQKNNFKYLYIYDTKENLKKFLSKEKPAILVTDFNPLFKPKELPKLNIVEVDSYNIVPARYNSESQVYNAASFRRKTYKNIYGFLTEFPKIKFEKNEGYKKLKDFVNTKLFDYAKDRNNPTLDMTSGLSPYLNLGFISAQRIAIEVIKSGNTDENKEAFLEELIIRKELSDNFCLYSKDYKSFDSLPDWAKLSLNQHKNDIRTYIYSLSELENSKTNDTLWNASQNQFKKEGKIHGYMRMYWAKMIAQWSNSTREAIENAIYLNDKYGYDAPSTNGYVGILWSIGGLHDRPFQDFPVMGKIRRMTFNGAKSKFDVKKYIKKYIDKDN